MWCDAPRHLRNYLSEFATLVNCPLALVPIVLMPTRQTTTIIDNMTAYSTAVGPSSETKKRHTFVVSAFIGC
jgi:hypothetical protein